MIKYDIPGIYELDTRKLIRSIRDLGSRKALITSIDTPTNEGLEKIKEGGERCFKCYRLRLEAAAKYAKEYNFDFFCSTLSISPLKNAQKLNEIGEELSEIYKISHLPNDFKKKGGYKRSVELSAEYDLYRQNYCGCVFSKQERGL